MMPKKLIADIYGSYREKNEMIAEPAQSPEQVAGAQPADALAGAGAPAPAPEAAGGETPAGGEGTI